jgi:hypothetical protein
MYQVAAEVATCTEPSEWPLAVVCVAALMFFGFLVWLTNRRP